MHLIFNLHQVPQTESDAIKQLLDEHSISYYESSPGFWGTGAHALWLADRRLLDANSEEFQQTDAERLAKARALVAEYQEVHFKRARDDYYQALQQGAVETFGARFSRHPIKTSLLLILVALIVSISLSPFWVL